MSPEPSLNHPEPSENHPSLLSDEVVPMNARESFAVWYNSYPRKQGKAAALKAWVRVPQAERAACVRAQPAWNAYWAERNEPQFIPMASTWISQRRWQDDVPTAIPTPRLTKHERNRAVLDGYVERHTATTRTPLGLPGGTQ